MERREYRQRRGYYLMEGLNKQMTLLKTDSTHKEIWKDIKGWEGTYQVSNRGRVKSFTRSVSFIRLGKMQTFIVKGRIMKPTTNWAGYKLVTFNRSGYAIHRLVAQAFISNINNKPQINHKDSKRGNNHVNNLEWVTPLENMKHASINGRLSHKLTDNQVREIRAMYKKGKFGCWRISLLYGVNQKTIYNIIVRKRRKYV